MFRFSSRTVVLSAFAPLMLLAACTGARPMVAAKQEADQAYMFGNYQKAAVGYAEILERAPGNWEVVLIIGNFEELSKKTVFRLRLGSTKL